MKTGRCQATRLSCLKHGSLVFGHGYVELIIRLYQREHCIWIGRRILAIHDILNALLCIPRPTSKFRDKIVCEQLGLRGRLDSLN